MVASLFLLLSVVCVASVSTLSEDGFFAALLKRQEPGTPAYNCHDNCGTAIIISMSNANPCKDGAFLIDYKNCLQCAGPDNENIWTYYGNILTKAATTCGLSTEPLAGKQQDVGPAVHPVSYSPTAVSATAGPIATYTTTPISILSPSDVSPFITTNSVATPGGNRNPSLTASTSPQKTASGVGRVKPGPGVFGALVFGLTGGLWN